jgi:hypothetical protein
MSTLKPASALKAEELEEETLQGIGLTEVGERDYTVRQFCFFFLTELCVADVGMNANR